MQDVKKIERVLFYGLTVEALIEQLQDCPPEAKVVFRSDYGDHCHTIQALPICEVAPLDATEEILVDNAGYSASGVAIQQIEIDDDADEDIIASRHHFDVVVLG